MRKIVFFMFLLLAGLQSVAGNEVNFVAAAPDVD